MLLWACTGIGLGAFVPVTIRHVLNVVGDADDYSLMPCLRASWARLRLPSPFVIFSEPVRVVILMVLGAFGFQHRLDTFDVGGIVKLDAELGTDF